MLTRQSILDLFPTQRAGAVPPANVQTLIGEMGAFALLRLTPAATLLALTATPAAITNWTSSDSRGTGWTISTTGGTITIPVDDWYRVSFFTTFAPAAAGTVTAGIYVNGTLSPGMHQGATSNSAVNTFGALSFAGPVYLYAGQIVDVRLEIGGVQNCNVGRTVLTVARML